MGLLIVMGLVVVAFVIIFIAAARHGGKVTGDGTRGDSGYIPGITDGSAFSGDSGHHHSADCGHGDAGGGDCGGGDGSGGGSD